jgi:hypothetical protein
MEICTVFHRILTETVCMILFQMDEPSLQLLAHLYTELEQVRCYLLSKRNRKDMVTVSTSANEPNPTLRASD